MPEDQKKDHVQGLGASTTSEPPWHPSSPGARANLRGPTLQDWIPAQASHPLVTELQRVLADAQRMRAELCEWRRRFTSPEVCGKAHDELRERCAKLTSRLELRAERVKADVSLNWYNAHRPPMPMPFGELPFRGDQIAQLFRDRFAFEPCPDTATLTGWFANAVMRGYDEAMRQCEANKNERAAVGDDALAVFAHVEAAPARHLRAISDMAAAELKRRREL